MNLRDVLDHMLVRNWCEIHLDAKLLSEYKTLVMSMPPPNKYSNYIGSRVHWQHGMEKLNAQQGYREESSRCPKGSGSLFWGVVFFIGLILVFIVPPVGIILMIVGGSKS